MIKPTKPTSPTRSETKAPARSGGVRAIPEGYATVTAVLTCRDARAEVDFLARAFGAEQRSIMPSPEGDRVAHAEVRIGTAMVMLSDANPEMACGKALSDLGGSPVGFYLYVQDVDAAFKQATEAGATVKQEVQDMFWGDRLGTVECPEGFHWTLATHERDMSAEEIVAGQKAFLEEMKAKLGHATVEAPADADAPAESGKS